MQSPHSTGSSKLQRCTKAMSHIVDGVESDKKLRGENSLGERRINLSYWKWNRYQEIIFGLNCIASLNSFKSGGGCSGGGCVGRSCSSCVSHSGCICSRDSVADMELFWLSKIFLLLGKVIVFKKPFPCTSISDSSSFLSCSVFLWAVPQKHFPGWIHQQTAPATAADSQLLILDWRRKRNPLLWRILSLVILVPFQSKPKPKDFWILHEREQCLRGNGALWTVLELQASSCEGDHMVGPPEDAGPVTAGLGSGASMEV